MLCAAGDLIGGAENTGSSYAILRLAPVYSASFRLNLDRRVYIRPKIGLRVLGSKYELSICSVHNIVHFVTRWLEQSTPMSGAFNVADSESYDIDYVLQQERAAGRCRFVVHVPSTLCMTGLAVLETGQVAAGRQPGVLSTGNLRKLLRSAKWDSQRAVQAVGSLPFTLGNTPGIWSSE